MITDIINILCDRGNKMITSNIFLIGFMGTGKSTVASHFEKKYAEMQNIEMDEMIAEKERRSIPQIFAEEGEEYFRNLETQYLKELAQSKNQIVSCGGGIVLREENASLMKESGYVILLTASPEEILARVKNDEGRPLLKGRKNVAAIAELLEGRRMKYEMAADFVINTDGKTADEICEEIMKKIIMKEREKNV